MLRHHVKTLLRDNEIFILTSPPDTSLSLDRVNRHASDTRIGLMDSTVPIEALVQP